VSTSPSPPPYREHVSIPTSLSHPSLVHHHPISSLAHYQHHFIILTSPSPSPHYHLPTCPIFRSHITIPILYRTSSFPFFPPSTLSLPLFLYYKMSSSLRHSTLFFLSCVCTTFLCSHPCFSRLALLCHAASSSLLPSSFVYSYLAYVQPPL